MSEKFDPKNQERDPNNLLMEHIRNETEALFMLSIIAERKAQERADKTYDTPIKFKPLGEKVEGNTVSYRFEIDHHGSIRIWNYTFDKKEGLWCADSCTFKDESYEEEKEKQ